MTLDTLNITNEELIAAADILEVTVENQQALSNVINDGLNASSLKLLQNELSLNSAELSQLLSISTRTLSRRKSHGKLGIEESRHVFLLAVMAATANSVLENHESAIWWLKSAKKALNGKAPLNYTKTIQQTKEVIKLLHQIEHGVFI